MNPKKSGTMFIVLMIALIAFGVASAANVANIGNDQLKGLTLPNLNLNNQEQITTIGDPNYQPVYITKRIILNVTNNTTVIPSNTTINNNTSTNSSNK
jgi:flagellar basal body-associated protein FliL